MENVKLSNFQLHSTIRSFLMEHNQGALATTINNIPRSSPVMFFLGKDLDVYIISAGGEKFKAIEQNPNVCLLVTTEYLDYRRIKGVQIFGRAKTGYKGEQVYNEAREYINDKHLLDNEDVKIIKISPVEIVYLDSTKTGDRTKQILQVQ